MYYESDCPTEPVFTEGQLREFTELSERLDIWGFLWFIQHKTGLRSEDAEPYR